MSQIHSIHPELSSTRTSRILAFLYGTVAYLIGLGTILYSMGFVADVAVPKSIDSGAPASPGEALFLNLLLMLLFAVQHSVMARKRFKHWWTQYVPKSVERSTYVLLASLCLILLFWQWRPIPALVWQIDDPDIAAAVAAVSLVGWLIVFTSTFLIDHFELFGLRQVTANLAGREVPAPKFRTPFYYMFVRHPLYLGLIIAFWAAPEMSLGHLLFASVTTLYILLGALLEERDLMDLFGEQYRDYRKQVSMLIPWRRARSDLD